MGNRHEEPKVAFAGDTGSGRKIWRIAKHTAEFDAADLSGGGARITGARWNAFGRQFHRYTKYRRPGEGRDPC